MTLPADVLRVIECFVVDERERVRTLLDEVLLATQANEGARVVRCVLFLGEDLAKLEHYAAAAKADYRDVIWWAEYGGGETRLRDFSKPDGQ
jgi:hypothetical protein